MNNKLLEKYLDERKENANFSETSINNIRNMCDAINEKLDTDFGNLTGAGLLVGEVQSGKTSNFLALTYNLLGKNKFDIVIILGGTINDLKDQTVERMSQFIKSNNEYLNPIMDIKNMTDEIVIGYRKILEITGVEKKQIITCLKEKSNLEYLRKVISGLDQRILIIDDESDQATLNAFKTERDLDGKLVYKDEYTKINSQIKDIKNSVENSFLLLVTATPYANLIAPPFEDISPKWGYVLNSASDYCGLDEFHQEYDDEDSYKNNRIRPIKSLKINNENVTMSPTFDDASNEENEWYNGELYKAVISFVVGNVITRKITKNNIKYEMLVHSHSRKDPQNEIKNRIGKLLDNIGNDLSDENDQIKYEYRINSIKNEIKNFADQLTLNNKNFVNNNIDVFVNEISNYLKSWDKELFIFVNNGDSKMNKTQLELFKSLKDEIIIGADKIQRGITFKNLRVTFMPRVAVNAVADTILQRARWFGYRNELSEFITIFLNIRLINLFNDLITLRDTVNDFLNNNFNKGTNLRNINKVIPLPESEKVGKTTLTRTTVNPIEGGENHLSSIVQRIPFENFTGENELVEELLKNKIIVSPDSNNFVTIQLDINNLDINLLKIILNKLSSNITVKVFLELCKRKNIQYIAFTLIKYNETSKKLDIRTRSIKVDDDKEFDGNFKNWHISNLQQGKNELFNFDEFNGDRYYAGDRNIMDYYYENFEGEFIEIQIHNVVPFLKKEKNELFNARYMYSIKFKDSNRTKYLYVGKVTT